MHGAERRVRRRVRDGAAVYLGSRSDIRCHGEGLDAESPDERALGVAAAIAFQVPLVPGNAKRRIGDLNDKQVKVRIPWQVVRGNPHHLDRTPRPDSDPGLRTVEASGAHRSGGADHVERDD